MNPYVPIGLIVLMFAAAALAVPVPRIGVFVDREDIERARQRVAEHEWAKAWADKAIRIADSWLERDDAWIRQIMPDPGERFAYGVAGCPHCGGSWGRFAQNVASFDRPLMLVCPHCQTEFDLANPSGPYADHGEGIVVDGRQFWLRGTWNGFVTNRMWSAFSPEDAAVVALADAYALTGDDRYARKLIVIMDALATLSPQTNGPRDFDTDPNRDAGRLHHLTSIVYRAQVHFARALDMLGHHSMLDEPSPSNPAAESIWYNIRAGIFDDYLFKHFDVREGRLRTLHNHEADSVRAMLLVGILYGEPDYVRWGARSLQAFLDNTIDRDGLYYETSLGYANFSRGVFLDMAEMLARYRGAGPYKDHDMPARDELPFDGNFFNHPGLARLTMEVRPRISVLGRLPSFGNSGFDAAVWKRPGRPFERIEFLQTQRFIRYSKDEHWRRYAIERALELLPHETDRPGGGWWRTYCSLDEQAILALAGVEQRPQPAAISAVDEPDLFSQTGLIFLRSGYAEHRRAGVMRIGPNMPHAHDDQMALMLFARGRALSADIGYGVFAAHVHNGWAGRAIAHHTVVVNQDQTSNDRLFRFGPGGTIHGFYAGDTAEGGRATGVAWAEASLTQMFQPQDQVRDYRRTVFQIDLDEQSFYWIDMVDIDGGFVHDYSIHSNPLGDSGSFEIAGVDPQPADGVWTLAGLDSQWRDASFNRSGRSWGERLTVNGMIRTLPDSEPDEVNPARGWYPPPGNGYGFLHDVKLADVEPLSPATEHVAQPPPAVLPAWSATWRWQRDDERWGKRITMLPESPQRVITAVGPNINGTQMMQFVIARHGRPDGEELIRSRYAAVIEAFGDEPAVESVEALRQNGRIVGLRIGSKHGHDDLLLDARGGAIELPDLPMLDSGIAIIRRHRGELVSLVLSGGSSIAADGVTLSLAQPRFQSMVTEVDDAGEWMRLDRAVPESAVGSLITISNHAYAHGSAYRVGTAAIDGTVTPLNSSFLLHRARIGEVRDGGFASTAPLVFGYIYRDDTRFLHGKRIVSGDSAGRITAMEGFSDVRTEGFGGTGVPPVASNAEFAVLDVQPGDVAAIEGYASLTRGADGEWQLRSNLPAHVDWSADTIDTPRQ